MNATRRDDEANSDTKSISRASDDAIGPTAWYRIHAYGGARIDRVLVDKTTESCVYIGGRRHNKRSSYDCYFPTWQEARAFLLEKAEASVIHARRTLEYANSRYGNIKGLREPQDAALSSSARASTSPSSTDAPLDAGNGDALK